MPNYHKKIEEIILFNSAIHSHKMSFLVHFLYPTVYCHDYLVFCACM